MKECLQCKNQYEAKRPSSKFCSTNCRVKFHRNDSNVKNTETLQNVYAALNALLKQNGTNNAHQEPVPAQPQPKRIQSLINQHSAYMQELNECVSKQGAEAIMKEVRRDSSLSFQEKNSLEYHAKQVSLDFYNDIN